MMWGREDRPEVCLGVNNVKSRDKMFKYFTNDFDLTYPEVIALNSIHIVSAKYSTNVRGKTVNVLTICTFHNVSHYD